MSHNIGPFRIGRLIGTGATGKVKLAFHKETGERVAIKIVNKRVLTSTDQRESVGRSRMEKEIATLELMDHPNVLRLIRSFVADRHLFLITEYFENGDLFSFIQKRKHIDHHQSLAFFQQLIFGLDYLHQMGICHRDLKPENLLLDKNFTLKIADFGMCHLLNKDEYLTSFCGTSHYVAPEILSRKRYNGKCADVWSCGVILYLLLCGELPFNANRSKKLFEKIKKGSFKLPKKLTKSEKDLLKRMLNIDPKRRITLPEIKQHHWFKSNFPKSLILPHIKPLSQIKMKKIFKQVDLDILKKMKFLGSQYSIEELKKLILTDQKSIEKNIYYLYKIGKRKRTKLWKKISKIDHRLINKKNKNNSNNSKKLNKNVRNSKNHKTKLKKRKSLPQPLYSKQLIKEYNTNKSHCENIQKKSSKISNSSFSPYSSLNPSTSWSSSSRSISPLQPIIQSNPKTIKGSNTTLKSNHNSPNKNILIKGYSTINDKFNPIVNFGLINHSTSTETRTTEVPTLFCDDIKQQIPKKKLTKSTKPSPILITITNHKKKETSKKTNTKKPKCCGLVREFGLFDKFPKFNHSPIVNRQKRFKSKAKKKQNKDNRKKMPTQGKENFIYNNQNKKNISRLIPEQSNNIQNGIIQKHFTLGQDNQQTKCSPTLNFHSLLKNKKIRFKENRKEIILKSKNPICNIILQIQNVLTLLEFKWRIPNFFLIFASKQNLKFKLKISQLSNNNKNVSFRLQTGNFQEFKTLITSIIGYLKI
ncbi:protein kinase [Anaeramoeba flamelloides]|uniref:Protein kinase n=1 Tax=Anaeramoeba flamelloides TaxID=1746091 RepID=A0AAV7YDS3_9EUKA|nr:protein kinase [Anaeramoeba flamelloides]